MKYLDEFRSPAVARGLLRRIRELDCSARIMEVCGTHTTAISKFGLRSLLAPQVELISGPGCPVCVTSDADIDRVIAVARMPDVIIATFGDMMKVPGSEGSLADASAEGARVEVVYSPLEALEIAKNGGDKRVVFLGVGFETTAPAVASTLLQAADEGLDNFYLLSFHKLVPPALRALSLIPDFEIDGFILPGHVSTIIGSDAYAFLAEEFGIPCVITGFEPADILQAIYLLLRMRQEGPSVRVEYSRAVRPEGNLKALSVMERVFDRVPAAWRGLFEIPDSGLSLKEEHSSHDAGAWEVELPGPVADKGCRCGEVLCGKIKPAECPLFAKKCTPEDPVGPCMVSSEGTCASYYLYERPEDEIA